MGLPERNKSIPFGLLDSNAGYPRRIPVDDDGAVSGTAHLSHLRHANAYRLHWLVLA